jgi:AcrR family transcriptional regulator
MGHEPPDAVRDAILDAAEGLLGRFGYRKTTVEEIAREAGIGKGTIYLHFDSKKEVALATIDRLVDRVLERLEEVASSGRPAVDRLREILVARVVVRLQGVRHYAGRIDELLQAIRKELLERRSRHFEQEARVLRAVLEDGVARGELRVEDPTATARAMVAATNSLLPYDLSVKDLQRRKPIAELAAGIAELMITGIVP